MKKGENGSSHRTREILLLISGIFFVLTVFYIKLGLKTAFMFSLAAFFAPLCVLFLGLYKTPKDSKYIFGMYGGLKRLPFVILCIAVSVVLSCVIATMTRDTFQPRKEPAPVAEAEQVTETDLQQDVPVEKPEETPSDPETKSETPQAKTEDDPQIQVTTPEEETPDDHEEDPQEDPSSQVVDGIEITYTKDSVLDGDKQLIKVQFKNTTGKVFTGDIRVEFFNAQKSKFYGGELFLVRDLQPGAQSFGSLEIDHVSGPLLMVPEFSDVSFQEVASKESTVDEDVTGKLQRSYQFNFEGVDWYEKVLSITAYEDGTAAIVVDPSDEDSFLGNTILSCGKDYGITSVTVLDQSGKILAISK